MMKHLSISLMAFICLTAQFSSVAQTSQQRGPEVSSGVAELSATTTPAEVDGGRSPALTGTDALFPMRERHSLYRLCQGDVLEINFSFATEFNQNVTVQPDGFISLRGVEQLYIEGLALPEVHKAIRAAYASQLHDPEVTVVLKVFEKPYFVASGQVTHPGKYDLRGHTTVVEALSIAGGLTPEAKHSRVVLFRRRSDDRFEARLLDVKRMLNSRNLQEDIRLEPGDLLFVPQNSLFKLRRFLPASNLGMYWNPAQY
jgi:polysaccharide export outer membrane protein